MGILSYKRDSWFATHRDAIISDRVVWKVLDMYGQWLMLAGQYVAGVSNKLSNEKVAIIEH